MKFQNIPPTAFPRLLQLTVSETSLHSASFESYLLLCNFVQHVLLTRHRAINLLTSVGPSDQDGIAQLIERLRNCACENLDDHGSVFGLYILGAYKDASELVEEIFQNRNRLLRKEINHITAQPRISAAKQVLHETLKDCFARFDGEATIVTRIKRPGSLFAKLISTGKFGLDQITKIEVSHISERLMPYDLVGGEITVTTSNLEMFGEFTSFLAEYFASRNMPLTDQNVYSPEWMNRKSFEGKIRMDHLGVPFQLHVWDQKARRYEWLSYGNYKMNKLFYPLIGNWQKLLERDLGTMEYAGLVVSTLSQSVGASR